jgi:hypothetical protein
LQPSSASSLPESQQNDVQILSVESHNGGASDARLCAAFTSLAHHLATTNHATEEFKQPFSSYKS